MQQDEVQHRAADEARRWTEGGFLSTVGEQQTARDRVAKQHSDTAD